MKIQDEIMCILQMHYQAVKIDDERWSDSTMDVEALFSFRFPVSPSVNR